MCGISAVLETDKDQALDPAALAGMHEVLRHRGPDGEAFLRVNSDLTALRGDSLACLSQGQPARLAAGFHWLRIMDLGAESMQPLASADGRLWILFNGEIYNFRDLREELRTHGHRFRTDSDH